MQTHITMRFCIRYWRFPWSTAALSLAIALAGIAAAIAGEPAPIKNPFHQRPVWRIWTEDETPVKYANPKGIGDATIVERSFAPPPVKDRKYPDFPPRAPGLAGLPVLKPHDRPPAVAGFWDNCYATMDGAHTNMPQAWSDGQGYTVSLAGQFINVNYGFAFRAADRFALGVNFTSQSFANRGRHIVDDYANNHDTEQSFFFANCVRATPAHISYEDKRPEKVTDLYDGLFGHSYQSVGQSGSETMALLKMMLAGGSMPRPTKDLLSRNGAYVIPLLTIFKAALPFVDADGQEVPYESELRHRPAYSSTGDVPHPHFCPANVQYHAYDEVAHVRRMIELARGLQFAPPVALLKLVDLTVEKDGKTIVPATAQDERIKNVNQTIVRIWGGPGETLTARIDARESYDLQGRELNYECRAVHPNQRNVAIEPDGGPGRFCIRVRHDPKLPKGRIPVVLWARNGGQVPSNPVFVNFYWPEENELDDYSHADRRRPPAGKPEGKQLKPCEVTRNLRPVVDTGAPYDTLFGRPGQSVKCRIEAKDPEGFPVIFYRWPGEVGKLRGNQFTFDVPADDPGRMYPVHLVCSDGTGGFTGRLLKVLVSPEPPTLPAGWSFTATGPLETAGTVKHTDGRFEFAGVGPQVRSRDSAGTFAFQKVAGDADLMCRIDDVRVEGRAGGAARLGLCLRETLDDLTKAYFVGAVGNSASTGRLTVRWESRKLAWGGSRREGDKRLATPATLLRLVRRGPRIAAYVSGDPPAWEQLAVENCDLSAEAFAGLMLAVEGPQRASEKCRAQGRCSWLAPPGPALPMIAVKGTSKKPGVAAAPAEVEILAAGKDAELRYTKDGSDPTAKSEKYVEPVKLDQPGRHEFRVRAFQSGRPGQAVVAVVEVEKP